MVMSSGVTGPSAANCLLNSLALPTTSTAICSRCRYWLATRATSAVVTFSTPARYDSRKLAG